MPTKDKRTRKESIPKCVDDLCLMDDIFLQVCVEKNLDAANLLLRIILEHPELTVKTMTV